MADYLPEPELLEEERRFSLRWFANLSPARQVGYGCLIIVLIGAATMYCAGTLAFMIRPSLLQRAPTPTMIPRNTLMPAMTLPPMRPTFLNLPGGVLVATPTQAPIPTREPPTVTPTVDLTNPAPTMTATITGTVRVTIIPTRRITVTNTTKP